MEPEQQPKLLTKRSSKSSSKDDYEIVGDIGRGAYGRVYLVKRKERQYAMKQIEKRKLNKQQKQYQAFIERQLLMKMDFPGIVKLNKCFQDSKILYFILQYCSGGDLTSFITMNEQRVTEELRVFYIAEIICILEYLHNKKIVHRDLKPENILLSKEGHLKLIDFGTAQISQCTIINEKFKQQIQEQKKSMVNQFNLPDEDSDEGEEEETPRKRRSTFVGTSYYISPELLEKNICETPSDLWALGCIIYQMYYLQTPFQAHLEFQVFENIKNVDLQFPKNDLISQEGIDLIKRLLVKEPEERLGSNSKEGLMFEDLKNHAYFKGINFENIFQQEVPELKEEEIKEEDREKKKEKIERTKTQILAENVNLLKNNENILYQGVVEKRTFINYNFYYLAIFKDLSMIRIKSEQPEKKKNIEIEMEKKAEKAPAELVSNEKFKLTTKEKTYTFKSEETQKWVQAINERYEQIWSQK